MALFGGLTMNALASALPGMFEEEQPQPQKRRGGGLFGGLRNALGGFGDRAIMAQAALAGDYGAMAGIRSQQARLRAAQQEAEAEQAARANQVWGLKESGFGNAQIAAMSPTDSSQVLRERMSPYSQAPGTMRVTPSISGGEDTRFTAPSTFEQSLAAAGITGADAENLRRSEALKQALILQQGVDAQGRPFSQALDPSSLYNFGAASAPQAGGDLPRPRTPAERDALPPGTVYIAPDGSRRTR